MTEQKKKPCDYPKQEIKINWKLLYLHLNSLIIGGVAGVIAGAALFSFLTWSGSASCKAIERAGASGEIVYVCKQEYSNLFPLKVFVGVSVVLGYLIVYNKLRLEEYYAPTQK